MTIHVEQADDVMFCGLTVPPPGAAVSYTSALAAPQPGVVRLGEWRGEPEQIQRSNCPDCLLGLFMLGDHATLALRRLGLQAEAHDATAAEENPS